VPKGGGTYRVGKPYVVEGRTYYPTENKRYRREGTASWYGDDFHGRLTANGEVYDMEGISAAHPTLPMPSYARVTNLRNGRSLIVRVNDRGPFHEGREIDLSSKAAQLLEFHRRGTTRVRVEYVGPASLDGSDDRKLMATLREGAPAPASRSLFADSSKPQPNPVRREFAAQPSPRQRVAEAESPASFRRDDRFPVEPAPVRRAASDARPMGAPSYRDAPVAEREPVPSRAEPVHVAEADEPAQAPSLSARRGGAITAEPLPAPRMTAESRPRAPYAASPEYRDEPRYAPDRRVASARYQEPETDEDAARPLPAASRRYEPQVAARPLPPRQMAANDVPAMERGSAQAPRLVWQTGPAPARVNSAASYVPAEAEAATASGRGLY
jgi:rare lipoprotein A